VTIIRDFEVGAVADALISLDGGQVFVRNGDAASISVEVDGRDDDWEVSQLGPSVIVRPTRRRRIRAARISVSVPMGCHVDVQAVSADIRLDGRFGRTNLKTVSGDIELGDVDELELSSTSGDLRAGDVDGDMTIRTISGDIRAGAIGGRVGLTTTSGDVRVDRVGGDLTASTVSGDLRVERFEGDDLTVKTVAGDLDVGLPAGIRVSPNIVTFSGDTRMPPRRDDPEPSVPRRRVALAFKSVSGDITIRRLDA